MIARIVALSMVMLTSSALAENVFPLGIWYEGGVGAFRNNLIPDDPQQAAKQYDRDFADIAAHGINLVVVPNTPREHHQILLDTAKKHGLKLIIELGTDGDALGAMVRGSKPLSDAAVKSVLDEKLKPLADHEALWRLQLLDEPPAGSYERYARIAELLHDWYPHTPAFCCLAGVGNVKAFAEAVKPDVVAWDLYPIGVKTPPNDRKMLQGFATGVANAVADAHAAAGDGVNVWGVIQCHSITDIHRFPTPAEIRAMTWLTLATGNKGVFWFLYQTEFFDAGKTQIMRGLVDEQYQSSDRWDEIAKLTKEIQQIAPTLARLHPAPNIKVQSNQAAYALEDDEHHLYVLAVNLNVVQSTGVEVNRDGQLLRRMEIEPGGGILFRATEE